MKNRNVIIVLFLLLLFVDFTRPNFSESTEPSLRVTPGAKKTWRASPPPSSGMGLDAREAGLIFKKNSCLKSWTENTNKVEAFMREQESKFPLGMDFWVQVNSKHFLWRTPAGGINTGGCPSDDDAWDASECIVHTDVHLIGPRKKPPRVSSSFRTFGSTECSTIHYLRGVGRAKPPLTVKISAPSKPIKACERFFLKASLEINGTPFKDTPVTIKWTSPSGNISVPKQNSLGTYGLVAYQAGNYRLNAFINGPLPADIISSKILGTSFKDDSPGGPLLWTPVDVHGSINVKVGVASPIKVIVTPSTSVDLDNFPSGESIMLKAFAMTEGCGMVDITNDKRTQWLPSGSNTFVAPKPKETFKIASLSHPDLKAEACSTTTFEASMDYEEEDVVVAAVYGGKKGEIGLKIKPPEPDSVEEGSVTWITPSNTATFKVEQIQPISVKAIHDSGESDSLSLEVEPATLEKLVIDPPEVKKLSVGSTVKFTAFAHFTESCLDGEVTNEASWGPDNNLPSFKAHKRGDFFKTATYREGDLEITQKAKISVEAKPDELSIRPGGKRLNLDGPPFKFDAYLKYDDGVEEKVTKSVIWNPGREIRPNKCTSEEGSYIEATYVNTENAINLKDQVRVVVSVNCMELLGKKLDEIKQKRQEKHPDYIKGYKDWLATRKYIIEKGCLCEDVKVPEWMTKPTARTSIRMK